MTFSVTPINGVSSIAPGNYMLVPVQRIGRADAKQAAGAVARSTQTTPRPGQSTQSVQAGLSRSSAGDLTITSAAGDQVTLSLAAQNAQQTGDTQNKSSATAGQLSYQAKNQVSNSSVQVYG